MTDMIKTVSALISRIKDISSPTAYKINVGLYIFHVVVGIVTFLYVKHTPNIIGHVYTWKEATSWLWSYPLYAPEFYFYLITLILLWKKLKFVKYLIRINMLGILIFIFLGTFIGYSMQLSYFLFFFGGIVNLLKKLDSGMYQPAYFIIMGCIWLFYLINAVYWVKKIDFDGTNKS